MYTPFMGLWQKAEFLPDLGSFDCVQGSSFNLLFVSLRPLPQDKPLKRRRAEQVAGILRNRAPKEQPGPARLLSVLI